MILDIVAYMILLAFIAVGVSYLAVDSVIFEEPRNWLNDKLMNIDNDLVRNKLLDLVGCRYCTSFHIVWISALAMWDWDAAKAILPAYGLAVALLDKTMTDH